MKVAAVMVAAAQVMVGMETEKWRVLLRLIEQTMLSL